MKKLIIIIFISFIFGTFLYISKSLEKTRLEYQELASKANLEKKKNAEEFFRKCNFFPKDGYLKTESGYYFDLFKFINFIRKEQPDFEKEARKDPYKNLINYFGFTLNKNNECVIYTFTKNSSWDNENKKIISVKEKFRTFDLHDGGALGAPRPPEKIKPYKNPLTLAVSVSERDAVYKEKLATYRDGWRREFRSEYTSGKYIILPLIKYPEIKVVFKDIEVKNGFFNMDVLEPDIIFVYENYNGFGDDFSFRCQDVVWYNLPKNKKMPIQTILNISVPIKEMNCGGGQATRNYRLHRKYGAITPMFGTYVFNDIKPILSNSIYFVDQFITKEKRR